MGFIDDIKARGSAMLDTLSGEVGRYKNKNFMMAVAAGGAMMAAADGSISGPEKAKMAKFIQSSPLLKDFDFGVIVGHFNEFAGKIENDIDFGNAECLSVIAKIKGDADQARTLLRVACALGASDGNFDEDEKTVARKMCRELKLDPADFDL